MRARVWRKIKQELSVWRVGAIPGLVLIGLIVLVRYLGFMQSLEWSSYDTFLRLRPTEAVDERILIVGINEEDISSISQYPLPDREIADLIVKLQSFQPRVIGLDIFRNLPQNPGYKELSEVFKNTKNLVAIEKILPDSVPPPPQLPPSQLGFADVLPDTDGKLRRILLGTPKPQSTGEYKFYLALKLAEAYLEKEDIKLTNGSKDFQAMEFGQTELPRFLSNSGGYVGTDANGVQVLLNFRAGSDRFRTLSLNDIKTSKFNPDWIRDRIILIGITASSVKDLILTSATESAKTAPGRVYGVEIQAHATSQIISAVLDGRPLLKTLSDPLEYLWIVAWGILGIVFAKLTRSPVRNLLAVGILAFTLIVASYSSILLGWWIPVTPSLILFLLNGIGLTALFQYAQALKSRIYARQAIIERTFETIHNGPLQTLAKTLRQVRDRDLPAEKLLGEVEQELEKLNYELRGIYEFLQREPITQDSSLYLGKGLELNLQDPLDKLLFEVYQHTLERDFPCFKSLRIKVRSFEPINDRHLTVEQKRGLCRFLEEALCNVGKHATGLTRLEVSCTEKDGLCTLSIGDNGLGIISNHEGRGIQQFKNLARHLKGQFRRTSRDPKGTLCELSWRSQQLRW